MPYYETTDLEELVAEVEGRGESVVQVIPTKTGDTLGYKVITRLAVNDAGEPWLPSFAKETR